MMCGWNLTFFAVFMLLQFVSSTLPPSPSLSCFPNKTEVTVKKRLEDWLAKVLGESFPFEMELRVEDGGMSEGDDEGGKGEKEAGEDLKGGKEVGENFKGDFLRLRGKTGFFELDQVFTCDIDC